MSFKLRHDTGHLSQYATHVMARPILYDNLYIVEEASF